MNKDELLKDSVISFLNKKGPRNDKEEVSQFLQNFQSSSELNELLEVIDILEEENLNNMNQVISMSKNLNECFGEPLEQINSSFKDFNQDVFSFQNSQTKFNESYDTISSRLLPLIIIDRNIDLASELYKKLKIGLEEMDNFTRTFCVPQITQDALKNAVNYQLDKILDCHEYFQQTVNQNALDIFNQKIGQWEDEIVRTFQIEINSFNDYDIFFNKFDQEKYEKAKIIKEEILLKFYKSEFDVLLAYQKDIKLLTDSRRSEQFAFDFLNKFSSVLSSFSRKYQNRNPPNSFSQGVIHIFEIIFSNVVKFIDEQLRSNDRFNFSFQAFYKTIQDFLNKNDYHKDLKDKANKIFQPARENCSKELIKKWNKEIETTITQSFSNYIKNPNLVFDKTKKHVDSYKNTDTNHNDDSDTISNTVYTEFQGKYIIQEVYEIIHLIETDYVSKLENLSDQNSPEFVKLLINQSNLIVRNLNEINSSRVDHRRSTILIIFNTYDAISLVVSKFNAGKDLLPLSKLNGHYAYMNIFAPNKFSTNNVTQFFQYIQRYLVTDSMKMRFTSLFAEYAIFSMTTMPSSDINEDTFKKSAKRVLKIYENSIPVLKDTTSVKKLCYKAEAFFKSPQNSTMNDLISSFIYDISKKVEPNLLRIVNEINK